MLVLAGAAPAAALPGQAASLAARLAGGDSASEHWDLMARFTSGHALFVRTLLTNAGPGSNTAVVIGQIVFPDGAVFDFDNGRREGAWSASPDGLLLDIGGSELELRLPQLRFAKQSQKRGIDLVAQMRVERVSLAPAVGDPNVAATTLAPIECTFQVTGMAAPLTVGGFAMLRHAWSGSAENDHTRRWIDAIAGDAADGVVIWGLESPTGERRQWLSRTRDGASALETTDFELLGEGASGPEPGYPVPLRLALRGPAVDGTLALQDELVRVDPMAIMPQPFRWFLSRQIAPRRILSRATLRLAPAAGLPGLEAPALVGTSWTNPLP